MATNSNQDKMVSVWCLYLPLSGVKLEILMSAMFLLGKKLHCGRSFSTVSLVEKRSTILKTLGRNNILQND